MRSTYYATPLATLLFLALPSGYAMAGGMTGNAPGSASGEYFTNPHAGMYGSMGNVDSPYYRQFQPSHQRGMSGG